MKALTLWQPYASAIGRVKRIETRGWKTPYRGHLAIHAAVRPLSAVVREHPPAAALEESLVIGLRLGPLPRGYVITIARLVDIVPVDKLSPSAAEREWGDFSPGRYGWVLEEFRFIEPVPANGMQTLWEWTPPPVGKGNLIGRAR